MGEHKRKELVKKDYSKILLPLLGVSLVFNGYTLYEHRDSSFDAIHIQNQHKHPLLSKRIFTENPNDILLNFIPLRKALREYVELQKGAVGVYFEYLPSGISIGVNDREEVRLASLSKVPLAMSIMKKIERGGLTLDTKITIKEEYLDKKFGNLWEKGAGTTLTVEELLRAALQQSDNTAYDTLFNQLTADEINEVYENLDVEVTPQTDYSIVSPKSYSSIFRSLYLSSFLIEEHSSYLLDILTKKVFAF
jgi:hypothetical protein